MDRDRILERLKGGPGFVEIGEVRTFQGSRYGPHGTQDVVIHLIDGGEGMGEQRYRVTATEVVEPGYGRRMITGHPAASVERALDNVNWGSLDEEDGSSGFASEAGRSASPPHDPWIGTRIAPLEASRRGGMAS